MMRAVIVLYFVLGTAWGGHKSSFYRTTHIDPFQHYGSVELFEHFVPEMTLETQWFISGHKSNPACKELNISIYLQQGSYPLMPEKNIKTYPQNFYLNRTEPRAVKVLTDQKTSMLKVAHPLAGSWFGVAFVDEPVKYQAVKPIFAVACSYYVSVNVTSYFQEEINQLSPGTPTVLTLRQNQTFHRFFLGDSIWKYEISVQSCAGAEGSLSTCPVTLYTRAGGWPGSSRVSHTASCHQPPAASEGAAQACTLAVTGPAVNRWHYLKIVKTTAAELSLELDIQLSGCSTVQYTDDDDDNEGEEEEEGKSKTEEAGKSRQKRMSNSSNNNTSSSDIHRNGTGAGNHSGVLKADPNMNQSTTGDLRGGSATPGTEQGVGDANSSVAAVSISPPPPGGAAGAGEGKRECGPVPHLSRLESMYGEFYVDFVLSAASVDELAEVNDETATLIQFALNPGRDSGGLLRVAAQFLSSVNTTGQNVSVDVCIQKDVLPVNGTQFYCHGNIGTRAVLPATDEDMQMKVERFFPFPESGAWFLALQAVCSRTVTAANGASEMVEVPCPQHYLVKVEVSSSPCFRSGCSGHGECMQVTKGMYLLSVCSCHAGYQGYACEDDSAAYPDAEQLMFTLFLTLSNLFFVPGILVACYRRYFVEAFVYFANMFFSTFYHACDMNAWSLYKMCIVPYHVLSYSDFFLSVMSFWVTLIAVAELPGWLASLAHLVGAVAMAISMEWKEHNIWTNVAPMPLGATCIALSWAIRSYKRKKCYPGKKRLRWLVPGVVMAGLGMAIFGFLETTSNYPYTHSIWHICMSLAIVFLLPVRCRKLHHGRECSSLEASDDFEFRNRRDSDTANLIQADDVFDH